MSIVEHRVPPHDVDAERCALGAAMLDADALLSVFEQARQEHFYDLRHREVFRAFWELYGESKPIDLVSVASHLHAKERLMAAGGQGYLAEMIDAVPTPRNVEGYLAAVRDVHIRRELVRVGTEIVARGFAGDPEMGLVLDEAERSLFAVAEHGQKSGVLDMGRLAPEEYARLVALSKQGRTPGLATGLARWDAITGGLQEGDLVIIAARPSVGKTALACTMAANIAAADAPVAIFSLEMTASQLTQRMLCILGDTDLHLLRRLALRTGEWERLGDISSRLARLPIFVDDTPALSPMEIRAKARRLVAREGVKMVVVDYLQLVRDRRRGQSRQQEVSDISSSLKALAKELNVPVLALSQLSRDSVKEGRKPNLSDLRESGALEQDADVVALMWRPREDEKAVVTVDIAKQRNGPTGRFDLAFVEKSAQFADLEMRRGE